MTTRRPTAARWPLASVAAILVVLAAAAVAFPQTPPRTVGEGLYAVGYRDAAWFRQPLPGEVVPIGSNGVPIQLIGRGFLNPAGQTPAARYGQPDSGSYKGPIGGERFNSTDVTDVIRSPQNPLRLQGNASYALSGWDVPDLQRAVKGNQTAYEWLISLVPTYLCREPGTGKPIPGCGGASPCPKCPTCPPDRICQPCPAPAPCPAATPCPACPGPPPIPAPVLEALRRLEAAASLSKTKPVQIGAGLRGHVRTLSEYMRGSIAMPGLPSTGRLETVVVPGDGEAGEVYSPASSIARQASNAPR